MRGHSLPTGADLRRQNGRSVERAASFQALPHPRSDRAACRGSLTRSEAARLRNENLNLRKELEQSRTKARAADKSITQDRQPPKIGESRSTPRTYVVQSGDTLASISRRFYRSSARWKEILDANRKSIDDPEKLRVGQSLVIP
ncbi:MAG: hypothetical protein DME34_07685 [Verrucomicrobia bacterium]|nr:MAG: hypothetical protein DME34_07685 [Verrucomicrobiota bacterium]